MNIKPIATAMGADAELLPYCVIYGRILLAALPAFMLQNLFQSFLVTAGKPTMGLAVTVGAGLTNVFLDALFIIVLRREIAGAAIATIMAQCVGGIVPFIYFARKNDSVLKFGKYIFDGKALFESCTNGLSELVTNISMSVVAMLTEMTVTAFHFYAVSVLFCGFSIFGSAFFTALNNGVVSAAISFLRTLVFQVASVLILPLVFGLDGVGYSLFVAEILSAAVTFIFYAAKRKNYTIRS